MRQIITTETWSLEFGKGADGTRLLFTPFGGTDPQTTAAIQALFAEVDFADTRTALGAVRTALAHLGVGPNVAEPDAFDVADYTERQQSAAVPSEE